MRFLALLVGLVAAFGGSYGAFAAVRAVGPENRTHEFGYGDAATVSPNGGDLLESANFKLVIAALEREIGADGLITNLSVERDEASANVKVGDRMRTIQIDASGRAQSRGDNRANQTVWMPVSRLDPAAIDAMVVEASEAGARARREPAPDDHHARVDRRHGRRRRARLVHRQPRRGRAATLGRAQPGRARRGAGLAAARGEPGQGDRGGAQGGPRRRPPVPLRHPARPRQLRPRDRRSPALARLRLRRPVHRPDAVAPRRARTSRRSSGTPSTPPRPSGWRGPRRSCCAATSAT